MRAKLKQSLQRSVLATAAVALVAGTYIFALTGPITGNAAAPSDTPDAAATSPLSSPSLPAAGVIPHGPGGRWRLAFDDEFDGPALDTSKWVALDNRSMNNVTNYAGNVTVSGGNLRLNLQSATSGAGVSSAPYDGAGVGGYLLAVGDYAEARVYFPGDATEPVYNWPAWWASGPQWPAAGEHDIFEGLGGDPTVNYHSPSGAHNQGTVAGVWGNDYHVFGLYRRANSADVYWDGHLVKSYPTDDDGQPEALILNVGASRSRTPHPGPVGQVKVDWVRAWHPAV